MERELGEDSRDVCQELRVPWEEGHEPCQRIQPVFLEELPVLRARQVAQRRRDLNEELGLLRAAGQPIGGDEAKQRRHSPVLRQVFLVCVFVGDVLEDAHDVYAQVVGRALWALRLQDLQQGLQQPLLEEVGVVALLLRVLEQDLRDVQVRCLHARTVDALCSTLHLQKRQGRPRELEDALRVLEVLDVHEAHHLPKQLRSILLRTCPFSGAQV
mmetsp:Transcript_50362/g.150537  ORF Transcript_50362/g.150537 Transcript_50362/m.150537 type:complete len:214 (-) Transcript_50362:981-1622(-)